VFVLKEEIIIANDTLKKLAVSIFNTYISFIITDRLKCIIEYLQKYLTTYHIKDRYLEVK